MFSVTMQIQENFWVIYTLILNVCRSAHRYTELEKPSQKLKCTLNSNEIREVFFQQNRNNHKKEKC